MSFLSFYLYRFATDFIDIREKETRRGTRGVGNPEKRGKGQRMHQRRQQQQLKAQQQMLADDASVSMTSSVNNDTMTTAKQPKDQQQQHLLSPTANATQFVSSSVSAASASAASTSTSSDLKSLENTNKTVNDKDATHSKARNNVANTANAPLHNISNMTLAQTSKRRQDNTQLSGVQSMPSRQQKSRSSSVAPPRQEAMSSEEDDNGDAGGGGGGGGLRFKPEDLLELQERITKEILNSKLQEKEMLELQVSQVAQETQSVQ